MTRDKLIAVIAKLYPADSNDWSTKQKGQELLRQARDEHWRGEPLSVLERYACLCQIEDALAND